MNLEFNPMPLYNHASEDFSGVDHLEYCRALDVECARLSQLRDTQGPATPEQRDRVLRQLLALQQEDGSFPVGLGYREGMDFDDSGIDESDVIDYVYDPAYLVCQVLARALLDGAALPGLRESLDCGLAFSCGRALMGESEYWLNGISTQIANVRAFACVGLSQLEMLDTRLCPEFMLMLDDICADYQVMLDQAATVSTDECSGVTFALMEAMDAWGCVPYIALFVQDSLADGALDSRVMEGCQYLSRALADGLRGLDEQVGGGLYLCTVADVRRIQAALGVTNPDNDLSGSPYVLDVADVTCLEDDDSSASTLTTRTQRVYLYAPCAW